MNSRSLIDSCSICRGLLLAALAFAFPSCSEHKPATPVVADDKLADPAPAQPIVYDSFVAKREFHHCDALPPGYKDKEEERDNSIGYEYTIANSGGLILKNVECTVTLTVGKTRKKEDQETITKKFARDDWAPGTRQTIYGATGAYQVVRVDLKGRAIADGKNVILTGTLKPNPE